jgi:uncharacterized protein (TIGR02996 family)
MNQHQGFLQDILEHPDEDAPRLIYADWLDENGDPDRAEFIRVQCLQASLPWDDDRQSELLAREAQLLAQHYEEWTAVCGDWPDREEDGGPGLVFRRGFIEQLRYARLHHFLRRAPAIFAACPVRDLRIQLRQGQGPDLAACSYLSRLGALRLTGQPSDVLAVCGSPHLDRLETLEVWGFSGIPTSLGDEGFRNLLTIPEQGLSSGLQALRCLCVGSHGFTDDALAALVASPLVHTLTGLSFFWNPALSPEGLRLLVSSPLWERLEELDLDCCSPNLNGAGQLLAEALSRSRLRCLRWSFDSSLAGGLANAPTWGPLRRLSLRDCPLGGEGLRLLLDCPHSAGLTSLALVGCGLGDDDLEFLAGCPRLCGLTGLWLGDNLISDRGASALAESPYLKRLRQLHLKESRITDAGFAALVRSANVEHLCHLSLGPGYSAATMTVIARSPRLDHLYALLGGWFRNAEALTLARSPFLRCLTHVRIHQPRVSETGKKALRQATHGVWGRRGAEERSEPFFSWEA